VTEPVAGLSGPDALRWNFFANVMDGALFSLGLSFVSQQTVLPVMVKNIGGGNIAVGLIPVLWTLFFNFPQFLIAPVARRTMRKKSLFLKTAFLQRLPWLLLGAAAFFVFGRVSPGISLLLFFVLFALAALGGSLNLPVWFDLIARMTPVHRRGKLFGTRSILGSLLGILGGILTAQVLGSVDPPVSFAALLSLAFAAMMVSYLFLVSLKEPQDVVPEPTPSPAFGGMFRILRSDRNLRNFLVADALQISAGMGLAFFTVNAIRKFSLPDSSAGTFTVLMMVSIIAAGVVFGPLGDRYGHKLNLLVAAGATFVSGVTAIAAPDPVTYGVVFVAAALSLGLVTISRLPLLAELSVDAERPTVIALANMVTSPFVFWGIAGGAIADLAGYEWVFALASCFALAALLWLSLMVREPRHVAAQYRSS
jgi:MFS family permease